MRAVLDRRFGSAVRASGTAVVLLVAGTTAGWGLDGDPRVGVLDWDRLEKETALGIEYAARIDRLRQEVAERRSQVQRDLAAVEERLRLLEQRLAAEREAAGPRLEERRHEIARALRERETLSEDARIELGLEQETDRKIRDLRTALQHRLRPFVTRTVRERIVDVLLDARFVVFVSLEFDISDEVIARANEEAPAPGRD